MKKVWRTVTIVRTEPGKDYANYEAYTKVTSFDFEGEFLKIAFDNKLVYYKLSDIHAIEIEFEKEDGDEEVKVSKVKSPLLRD